jgi:5'(3')-deoxyribonucleotidase
MDGVVADFNEYAFRVHGFGSEVEYPDNLWNQIARNPRLYRDLKKTPYADDLVNFCRTFAKDRNMELYFLTAVPKSNKLHWAFYDKVMWGQTYFPDVPVHFGPFSKDKQFHCKQGDILIDDRIQNIDEWNRVGGIGILHDLYENTIFRLKNL